MKLINPNPFTTRPEIVGTFGVVTSTHWIATAVGMGARNVAGPAICVANTGLAGEAADCTVPCWFGAQPASAAAQARAVRVRCVIADCSFIAGIDRS